MKVAVVGATGLVGRVMLQLLEERGFPVSELLPVASQKSVGTTLGFRDRKVHVVGVDEALAAKPDLALFSAGGGVSRQWAPQFAESGTTVIDNSSAWRMDPEVKLVVPEINAGLLTADDKLIANPNCSTIQLVMVLAPLHREFGLKRVVVSTYQSVSGTGIKAVRQLENEAAGVSGEMVYPYPIHMNVLPHCDVFDENGYTLEELKLSREPQKILGDRTFSVTATAVRVPASGGHSESVNAEFSSEFETGKIRRMLNECPGITVQDNPQTNTYPMPVYANGKDDVFVGRIRRDHTRPNALHLWIVSDNLRKGAATNAIQIAEYLANKGLLVAN